MDNLQALKSLVRTIRKEGHDYGLTYAQHLDAASRLLYGASSLNHFAAAPDNFTKADQVPGTMTGIFERLQNTESLFKIDEVVPVSDYGRFEKWMLGAEVWLSCLRRDSDEAALLVLLKESPDIVSMNLPGVFTSSGSVKSILDEDAGVPALDQLQFILHSWLPVHATHESGLLIEHWEALKAVARGKGLNERDADYYRSICRESFNHSWSLCSMVALGVMDIDISNGSFFDRHSTPEEAVKVMEMIWDYEEPSWEE